MLKVFARWASLSKTTLVVLYLAAKDPRTPWYSKGIMALAVAYAISPIDLVTDLIPVLGLLDDMVIAPFGLWVALRSLPMDIRAEKEARAAQMASSWQLVLAGLVTALVWIACLSLGFWLISQTFAP